MKKSNILLLMLFILSIANVKACEICGCGHSNFQIGLLPTFTSGFAGFRYSFSKFDSRVRDEPTEFSHDYYQILELWGGYNYKRIQLMTFMPYVMSRKISDDGTSISNGLGDAMLLINYKIIGATVLGPNEKTTVRNEVFIGGGIKLPTGDSDINVEDPEFNIGDFNSHSGTGSFDYMLNGTYNLQWNNSGVITNLAYRINSSNRQDYRFGNRTYINAVYFYTIARANIKFKPNAGINYQSNTIDRFRGDEIDGSNGYIFTSTFGANIIRRKIGFNAMTSIPIVQNHYDGQTKLKWSFMIGVTYSI